MKLLILGAGGHGRVCGEIAAACGYEVAFLDDITPGVAGKLEEYVKLREEFENTFIAIGNPKPREEWFEKLKVAGYKLVSLISDRSVVSDTAEIGEGCVVMAGAVIQSNTKIGSCGIVSAGAIVDHDSTIGSFCHVNCGAIVPSMSTVPDKIKVNYGEVWKNV